MVPKYYIVLFKNKTRKKIIKKFSNLKNAEKHFNELKSNNSKIIFPKKIENGIECEYEIAFLQNKTNERFDVYRIDEMGRNIKVIFEDSNFDLVKIASFKIEEEIFDLQKHKKISTKFFVSNTLKGDGLKMISTLNNKIIVQLDDKFFLYSVKNIEEAKRFVECLSQYFYSINRKDCMFVTDESTAQKKYLIELLSSWGIEKRVLYQRETTYPR